ncbi:MAG TPA: RIP metalloprotease RseP [Pyrinomonadaceae bacterium]|nr:RIP metalloprotease RseP [Pyrinomonadaceae bacterium]
MEIIIAILAVVFVLGVAINIHEFGHFIVAKLLGMRVEAYSFFGLGPRIWGFKRGHTDYRISAIPLGAYVKLYGDEATSSLEGGESQGEAVPESELYELRPRWQKFLVMVGGPTMNILLALAIPFSMALFKGVPATPSPIVEYVKTGGAGDLAGIKTGDRIIAFDGIESPTWQRVQNDSMLSPEKEIPLTVERGGQRIPLTVKPTKVVDGGNTIGMLDIEPEGETEPVVVDMVQPGMPAEQAGLQKGDLITSFNGTPVRNRNDVREKIKQNGANPILLTVNRNGEVKDITATAKVEEGKAPIIGVQFGIQHAKARESVGIGGAAAFAWNSNMEILRMTAKAFGQVSKGERSAGETFSGPIGIVQIISQVATSAGFEGLLFVLGLISLNLGIFNLLPIPMLDGGQIMVLGIEKVYSWFGRTLSMAVKERIQLVGLAVILCLMVFTIFNDISRFFR